MATSSITAPRLTKFQVFGIQFFSGCASTSLVQAIDNPDILLPDARNIDIIQDFSDPKDVACAQLDHVMHPEWRRHLTIADIADRSI